MGFTDRVKKSSQLSRWLYIHMHHQKLQVNLLYSHILHVCMPAEQPLQGLLIFFRDGIRQMHQKTRKS